jgi:rhodanese-related sulfurtransferase
MLMRRLANLHDVFAALLVFLLLLPPQLPADVQLATLQGVTTLDAESLITLARNNPDLIVIDSRVAKDRQIGFIEGSISLPNDQTSCKTLFKISKNKSQALAFYCNGINCGRSAKAVQIARQCGYKNLYWFQGGFEEWRLKEYPYLME